MKTRPSESGGQYPRLRYWELPDFNNSAKRELLSSLNRKGYKVKRRSKKGELVRHRERLERGLISYTLHSKDALLSFVSARGLSARPTQSRENIEAILEQADTELQFEHFLDLPPELRIMVNEYYIDSLPNDLETLMLPPLGLTSKQMQCEIQPILYDRGVFQLTFVVDQLDNEPTPDLATSTLLQNLSQSSLTGIRNIRIRVGHIEGNGSLAVSADVTITLGSLQDANNDVRGYTFHEPNCRHKDDTTKHLERFIDRLTEAEFRRGFEEVTIHRLKNIVGFWSSAGSLQAVQRLKQEWDLSDLKETMKMRLDARKLGNG